ncbi:hypothetical protein [Planctomyces sp. SH-PL14]|uniref:hypothetical protein n=1 Tax=Planctomyces sp. SH-PL14 TaxID=1632864 RepID=UPI00078BC7A9|nr:hypothetical protein [Planctomyces sp. SH-PL14]AMV16616.1 hypothetical protein VT03_01920 [Planctomyces sp. SH-PL14]
MIQAATRYPVLFDTEWEADRYIPRKTWEGLTDAHRVELRAQLAEIGRAIFVGAEHVIHMPAPYVTQKARVAHATQHVVGIDDRRIRHNEQMSIVVSAARNRTEAIQMVREFLADVMSVGGLE